MGPSEYLRFLVNVLDRLAIRYLVTGSVATSSFGEPRFTNDIDVIVDLPAERIADFCAAFPAPEFYISESAVRQAVNERRQFNIIHPTSGLKVDVIIPKDTEFDRSRMGRGVLMLSETGNPISFASPEDVIIKKLQYFQEGESDKHLRDITGILKAKAAELDVSYITRWAAQLGVSEIWQAVRARVGE